MTQILSLLATFILTTVVGNYLLQNWQHRGWVRQQQFLGSEKEYLELRSLSTEISGEIGARLYQTKRLLWAVRSFSLEIVEQRLAIYDTTQVRWNEKLGVFFVGLTLFADYSYTNRLET